MREVVRKLVGYLKEHPSLPSAQYDYKLEEWAAVETFCFFHRHLSNWYASPGSLPYLSKEHKKEDKWCDVYAREIQDDKTVVHLWIEYKALPFGATSRGKTLQDFAKDIRSLSGLDREQTITFWQTWTNPRTKKKQTSWFGKFDSPGSIAEGVFHGVAILLAGVGDENDLTAIQDRLSHVVIGTSSELIVRVPALCKSNRGSLACLAYEVPISSAS